MAAPLDTQEAEKYAEETNDAHIPVKMEKENNEFAEKQKSKNGFLVRMLQS
jgi:hypothetical protein